MNDRKNAGEITMSWEDMLKVDKTELLILILPMGGGAFFEVIEELRGRLTNSYGLFPTKREAIALAKKEGKQKGKRFPDSTPVKAFFI